MAQEPQSTSGTMSLWSLDVLPPGAAALGADATADVVVVGSGIAGLTTAYLLLKEGKSVVVLERGQVGQGETSRTSAHLSNALDDGYQELARIHGKELARQMAQSHTAAIARIFRLVEEEGIDCDLEHVPGYLFLEPGDRRKTLHDEWLAANQAGVRAQLLESVPHAPGVPGPCLLFDGQAQFHPLKYLYGLAAAVARLGGRIHSHSPVTAVYKDGVEVQAGWRVNAEHVVIATNTPINDRVVVHTKQASYRSYLLAGRIPPGTVPAALYWDTGHGEGRRAYHYVRVVRGRGGADDLLLVGGQDHKTGQPVAGEAGPHEELERWARAHFPMLGEVVHRWSGQVIEPVDGAAFIGKNPADDSHVHIITGDSGHGLTHATLGAMLITDHILGRENPWTEAYRPNRVRTLASATYARENANTLSQYRDLFTPHGPGHDLAPGEGEVRRHGLSLVAAYRDAQGELHTCSAVCPHLGGVVRWNAQEKTFDCPCHGSRFDGQGQVLNGPANRGLTPVAEGPSPATPTVPPRRTHADL